MAIQNRVLTFPVSSSDEIFKKIGTHPLTIEESTPTVSTSPEAQAEELLCALWQSPNRCHQLGVLNRLNCKFKNLPIGSVSDAVKHAMTLSSEGCETYLACAEFLTPDSRTSANATGACGFWLDVDCGEDKAAAGKGYSTVEDAEAALYTFCDDTGLPKPTHVVNSGGGLHAYWVVDKAIDRDTWQSHAKKLKELTKTCGFLADDSRTADIASVLRIPGTLNFKYSPPRPVVLEYASDKPIDRSLMLDVINDAHNRLCSAEVIKRPGNSSATVTVTDDCSKNSGTAGTYGEPDLTKLSSALVWLDPDCDEEIWKLRRLAPLALAAHNHPDLSPALYALARSWSSGELTGKPSMAWITPGGNGLTGEAVFDSVWERFLTNEYAGIPTTLRTIFYDARQAGWDPMDQFQIVVRAEEGVRDA